MNSKPHSRGITLIEILIVIGILAVLASISFAVYGSVLSKAKSVNCLNNLKQIGLACITYATDNNGELPATQHNRKLESWVKTLQDYADGGLDFKCPEDPRKDTPFSYAVNDVLTPPLPTERRRRNDYSNMFRVPYPNNTVYFTETADEYQGADHFHFVDERSGGGSPEAVKTQVAVERHNGSANYLFVDGHVEAIKWPQVKKILEKGDQAFVNPNP